MKIYNSGISEHLYVYCHTVNAGDIKNNFIFLNKKIYNSLI